MDPLGLFLLPLLFFCYIVFRIMITIVADITSVMMSGVSAINSVFANNSMFMY